MLLLKEARTDPVSIVLLRGNRICAHYGAAAVGGTEHQPTHFSTNGAREVQSVAASATHNSGRV